MEDTQKAPWKRLLWIKQDYPDNYTDPKFLEFLKHIKQKRNSPPTIQYDCGQIRYDFLKVYNIFLNTCFMYITFTCIYYYECDPIPFTVLITAFTIICSTHRTHGLSSLLNFKSSMIITFTMLTLSPVLKSLSRTTASDSIWNLSFWLSVVYLFTCATSSLSPSPPSTEPPPHSIFLDPKDVNRPSSLSTNVLVANVAVLASRLKNTTEVFCFLFICTQLNIVLPRIINISKIELSALSNLSVYLFVNYTLGPRMTLIFLMASLVFIQLLPRLFFYWQVNYRRRDYEILDLWDPRTPILD